MDIEQNSEKSLEELAREAMEAIKKSEKDEKEKEEAALREEIRLREEALQEEVNQKIKRKLRRLEKEESKKFAEEIQDPNLMVNWKNTDKSGVTYEGHYNDNYIFRIKRGLNLYHLYVEDKNLMIESWQRSTCTSIDLKTLKEKADKILKESIKKAEEAKRLEKESKVEKFKK